MNVDETVSFDPSARPMSSSFSKFSVKNGIFKQKGNICVPSARDLRIKVLQDSHDGLCAGHLGMDSTLKLVKKTF